MSSQFLPKIEGTRINASLTFLVFTSYLIVVSYLIKGFPDFTQTSVIVLMIFNVSLFTLMITMLNITKVLRRYFGKTGRYTPWYGSDEKILLNIKNYQLLVDKPISKWIIGFTLLMLSLGIFLSENFANGLVGIILLGNSTNSVVVMEIVVGLVFLIVGFTLIIMGRNESIRAGMFSWHYIFKLRIERIERGKETDLVKDIRKVVTDNIDFQDHESLQQVIDQFHHRIFGKFISYQRQVQHFIREFKFDDTGLWIYPEYSLFVNNITNNRNTFSSNTVLSESTNFYKFNLDDEIEDHRVTIFDILFDMSKSSSLHTPSFSIKYYLRLIMEIDYFLTMVTKFVVLKYAYCRMKEDTSFSLEKLLITDDVIIHGKDEENSRYDNYETEFLIISLSKFMMHNPYIDSEVIKPVDIRFKTGDEPHLRDQIDNYQLKPETLDAMKKVFVEEIKSIDLPNEDRSINIELKHALGTLNAILKRYKYHKLENNENFRTEFNLAERNGPPFNFIPFKMIDVGCTYLDYLRDMLSIREDSMKQLKRGLNEMNDKIGHIELKDLIFKKIDQELKKDRITVRKAYHYIRSSSIWKKKRDKK